MGLGETLVKTWFLAKTCFWVKKSGLVWSGLVWSGLVSISAADLFFLFIQTLTTTTDRQTDRQTPFFLQTCCRGLPSGWPNNDSSPWDVPVQLAVSMYHHCLTAVSTIVRHTVDTVDWGGSFNVINGPLQQLDTENYYYYLILTFTNYHLPLTSHH